MISNAKLSQQDAVLICACIGVMPGGGREEFLNRQKSFCERVKKLWPEILDKTVSAKAMADATKGTEERRALTLDEYDKTVLSLGLLDILRLPNSNGQDFINCEKFADACKIGKWFRDAVAKKPIPAFEGSADDELELGDDADESANETSTTTPVTAP